MGEANEAIYAQVKYSMERGRPLDARQQNRIISQAAARLIETAAQYDIRLSITNSHETSSTAGVASRRIMRASLHDQTQLIEAVIESDLEHRTISFTMKAKPNLKEEAYAALEKVLYNSSRG